MGAAPRNVVFAPSFDKAILQFGGYMFLAPILSPVIDALRSDPYGFELVEDDWIPLCRWARTKAVGRLPEFLILFTIENTGDVVLRDVFEPL